MLGAAWALPALQVADLWITLCPDGGAVRWLRIRAAFACPAALDCLSRLALVLSHIRIFLCKDCCSSIGPARHVGGVAVDAEVVWLESLMVSWEVGSGGCGSTLGGAAR